jgi:hypothetical protein
MGGFPPAARYPSPAMHPGCGRRTAQDSWSRRWSTGRRKVIRHLRESRVVPQSCDSPTFWLDPAKWVDSWRPVTRSATATRRLMWAVHCLFALKSPWASIHRELKRRNVMLSAGARWRFNCSFSTTGTSSLSTPPHVTSSSTSSKNVQSSPAKSPSTNGRGAASE